MQERPQRILFLIFLFRGVPFRSEELYSLNIRAKPKSQSFTTPCAVSRMFSGFTSLWMQLCWWQYATPCSVCHVICRVRSSGQPCGNFSSSASTVWSQNSNTRCSFRFRRNTSRRLTKFGCFRFWNNRLLLWRRILLFFSLCNCWQQLSVIVWR